MKKWSNMILMITLMLFLAGTISASDWFGIDNYDKFIEDGNYGTIEIWDTATTILFQPDDRKLVEYTLIDNTDQCLINCHAEGTATLYERGKLFSDLNFKDGGGKSVNLKEDKILIWNTYEVEVEVNDYKEVCEDVFNETNQGKVCHNEIVGTHKEIRLREEWEEYDFKNLEAGNYKWRIEGKKSINQNVDWVGTSFGKELTKWAWWNSDWDKKKAIYVNTTLMEKNQTSVLMNISYDTDMSSNFSGLRFVDGSETTEMGYWFYNNSYVASNSVWVWLYTENLSASENRTFYMYYDNDAVETTSDIEDAFWFGDDFNRTSVDYTNRYQSTVEASYTIDHVNNGRLNCSPIDSSEKYIITQTNFTDVIFESRVQTDDVVPDNVITFFPAQVTPGSWTTEDYMQIQINDFRLTIDGVAVFDGGVPVADTYYRFKFDLPLSGSSLANATDDNLVQIPTVHASAVSELKAGFPGFRSYNVNSYIDWWYVRRYMSTEPTYSFGAEEKSAGISITQSYPADNFNTIDTTPDLSCNFTGVGTENITDVTVLVYDSGDNLDYTDTEGSLNLKSYNKTWTTTVLTDDAYKWACHGVGPTTESYEGNRTLNIDATIPAVNITYPFGYINYHVSGENITLNWTVSDSHLQSCWYNYNTTNISVTCSDNSTQFIVTNYSNRNITFWANDSFGNGGLNYTSWNYKLFENLVTYNTSAYETDTETFSINFTSTGLQTITANFYHGGVDKGAGTKTGDNNEMTFTKSLDIPASIGNKTIYWKLNYGAEIINSPHINQTVNPIFLTYCNATNNVSFLNFTFKDETDGSTLNASNDLTDFSAFWLGGGSVTKSYTTSNSPENSSYSFCFSPGHRTLTTDLIFKYSSVGYPLRTFSYDDQTLTNLTTNQTLYLLGSASGIYVTFQVLSQAEQPIANVYALANRTISGTSVLVGSGYTGGDGGVTFWLNPDYEHDFLFSKTGYATTTATLTPAQPTYTIYMGTGVAAENVSDYSRGIRYLIGPGEYNLNQSSSYEFQYNLTSSYWDLDSFGFTLENASGYNLGSSSSVSGSGGNLSVILNTGTNKTIVMEYYWIIDGDSTSFTRSWYLVNASGTQWSIKTFFDDLRTYTDEGMFGLTEFGRTILIFIFIFISVGLVSYYSGMYSPAAILTMVFALVAFFDFGLNIIPNPVRAIPHFPTFFIALLAIGVWINEWRK